MLRPIEECLPNFGLYAASSSKFIGCYMQLLFGRSICGGSKGSVRSMQVFLLFLLGVNLKPEL